VDVEEHLKRHDRRAGFDLDADTYDRTRPVLPAPLFDDLVRQAGLSPGDRVLEIGCGTGQATVPLAERGLRVTAVELGPSLAARARTRLRHFRGVDVLTTSFEDWAAPPEEHFRHFRAVVAVNSLHWIDPAARYAKPARLLVPGGAVAVASCRWARPADADRFFFDVEEDYHAVGYAGDAPPEPDAISPYHFPSEGLEYFDEVRAGRYPFETRWSVEDYVANLGTQSSTRQLGDDGAREFLERVRARLRALGRTELTRTLVALLTVGRRRDPLGPELARRITPP
jgi:SAM-dependent methyltransferase